MNKKIHTLKYILFDVFASLFAWSSFFIFRKMYIEPQKFGHKIPLTLEMKYFLGVIFVPLFWFILHYVDGYYRNIYRKSRLQELWQTFIISLLGVIILFFGLILDDQVPNYKTYYLSILVYFSFQFLFTYIPRVLLTTNTIKRLRGRKIGFRTLLIGSNGKALRVYQDFESQKKSTGNIFVGFINIHNKKSDTLCQYLPHLGNFDDLTEIIINFSIEEVILAIELSEHEEIWKIINKLQYNNVIIKALPSMYDILTVGTSVKMSTPFSSPLVVISRDLMPAWQENMKRVIDVIFSIIAMILLLPVYIALAIGVKLSSRGPIFYAQERIGRYGKTFLIYKFRSMLTDAEQNGPALSSKNDQRITPFGKFMRRSRLDEIPQFFNVLIGDMSIVGPRPERQFFINQIVKVAPHYYHLHKVRPGITSWGQVKFGYAENIDEMVERLKYDLIYIENMSLYVDFKIMIYTIKIIFQGLGK